MSSGRSRNSKAKNQGGASAAQKRKTELAPAVAVVDVAVAEPAVLEVDWDGKSTANLTEEVPDTVENPPPVFKDPNYVGAMKETFGSKRTRKNLKQIIAAEKSLSWGPDDAKYVDPQTKLRYANADEFNRARSLPQDIVAGLLSLRKANLPVP